MEATKKSHWLTEAMAVKDIGSPRHLDDESKAKRIMFTPGRLMVKGDTSKSGICCDRLEIYLTFWTRLMQKNLTYKLLTTICLSGCSIDSSMNISNTYTTYVYHTTHACVKFVKTQFSCPKELHVNFHPISLPILTQLQNITHVTVTLRNVCWDNVMNAMTTD